MTDKKDYKIQPGKKCHNCGLPITDASWLLCPRCRVELVRCVGCESCGACKR